MKTLDEIIEGKELSSTALREVKTYKILRLEDCIVQQYKQAQTHGPGDTNSVNSRLAYELGITSKEPTAPFQLEFSRSAEADIDIDFSEDAREVAFNYVRDKYGEDKVAWIGTHTVYRRKTVFVDVCSCIGVNYHRAQEIGKECILPDPTNHVESFSYVEGDCVAKDKLPVLLDFLEDEVIPHAPYIKTREDFAALMNILIGTIKTSSTHACGVAVSSRKLWNMMPLRTSDRGITTQLPVNDVTNLCHKIDLLVINTLTTIYNTIATAGISIDDIQTDPVDMAVMKMIGSGHTLGVFQLGSWGLSKLCKSLHQAHIDNRGQGLSSIEDLAIASALFRPGPRDAKMDEQYTNSIRSGVIKAATPALTKCLEKSRGVIIFQEDVIKIAIDIAGYDPREADEVRQAVGKKKQALLDKHSVTFIDGCQKHSGMSKEQAEELWNHITTHGSYSFNKSHAIAYAYLSYYTAWLKFYYPEDFYAAYMNTKDNLDKVVEIINRISSEPVIRNGVLAKPVVVGSPDINRSGVGFTPDKTRGEIVYGLDAIRGIGTTTAEYIIMARPEKGFESVLDVVKSSPPRVNTKTLEALVWSGALDSLIEPPPTKSRSEMITAKRNAAFAEVAHYTKIRHRNKQREKNKTEKGRIPLPYDLPADHKPALFDPTSVCKSEQQALGRYVTMHPTEAAMTSITDIITPLGSSQSERINRVQELQNRKGKGYKIIGVVSNSRLQKSRKGRLYIRGQLEDNTGRVGFLVFGKEPKNEADEPNISKDKKIGKLRQILKNGNVVVAHVEGHGIEKTSTGKKEEDPSKVIIDDAMIIEASEEAEKYVDAWDDDWGQEDDNSQ